VALIIVAPMCEIHAGSMCHYVLNHMKCRENDREHKRWSVVEGRTQGDLDKWTMTVRNERKRLPIRP
jgi:hypothetical protein